MTEPVKRWWVVVGVPIEAAFLLVACLMLSWWFSGRPPMSADRLAILIGQNVGGRLWAQEGDEALADRPDAEFRAIIDDRVRQAIARAPAFDALYGLDVRPDYEAMRRFVRRGQATAIDYASALESIAEILVTDARDGRTSRWLVEGPHHASAGVMTKRADEPARSD